MKYNRATVFIITSIMLLPGCAKEDVKYDAHPLKPLSKKTAHGAQTHQDVTVCVRPLDVSDQHYYFGKRARNLHPLQITVENKSNTTWVLKKENISLPLADSDYVIGKYKFNPWTTVGLSIALLPVGIIHGVTAYNVNKDIRADITDKNINTRTIINPSVQRDNLIFSLSREELEAFTVTLIDANDPTHTLRFNLTT